MEDPDEAGPAPGARRALGASWMRPGRQLLPRGLTVSLPALDHCPCADVYRETGGHLAGGQREHRSNEPTPRHLVPSHARPERVPLNSCGLFCVFLQGKTPCCLSQGHRYFMELETGLPRKNAHFTSNPESADLLD